MRRVDFFRFLLIFALSLYLHADLQAQRKLYEIVDEGSAVVLLDSLYHQDLTSQIFKQKVGYVESAQRRDYLGMAENLQELSHIHMRMEDYEMSLNYLYASRSIARIYGGEMEMAIVKRRLGTIYTEMGLSDKGLEYLFESMEYLEKYPDELCEDLTSVYKNIGLNYVRQGQFEKCEPFFRKSLTTAKNCELTAEVASAYANLAGVLIYYEQYDSVDYFLDQSENLFSYLEDPFGLGTVNNNRAEYYLRIGQYERALALYEEAYEYYTEAKEDQFRLGTLKNLSIIHEKRGDYIKALDFSRDFTNANTIMLNQKIKKTIENMDVSHMEVQKRRRIENDLLLQNKQNKIKSYQVYLLSSLLIIIIIGGSLLLYNRSMKSKLVKIQLEKEMIEKTNLKEEIEFKDKELEGLALNITNKNRFLVDLREKLNNLTPNADVMTKQVRELKYIISQYLQSDKELADFNERVELLQQNFLHSISSLFPDLSENDKQLCVLLRLGISSKDIALMRNVSEKSVHMARYRLRKKMNLDSNDNLVEFLKSV